MHATHACRLVSGLAAVAPPLANARANTPVATLMLSSASLCACNAASHTHQAPSQSLLYEGSMLAATRWTRDAVSGVLALLCAANEPLVATGVLWAVVHCAVTPHASAGGAWRGGVCAGDGLPTANPPAAALLHAAAHLLVPKVQERLCEVFALCHGAFIRSGVAPPPPHLLLCLLYCFTCDGVLCASTVLSLSTTCQRAVWRSVGDMSTVGAPLRQQPANAPCGVDLATSQRVLRRFVSSLSTVGAPLRQQLFQRAMWRSVGTASVGRALRCR
jgi:hypothetical protein